MHLPRYNRFRVSLPTGILPSFLFRRYDEIIADSGLAGVYVNGAKDCLAESLIGIDMPGLHMTLIEQKAKDPAKTGYVTRYWPKGVNGMRTLDDDELGLTFRHIDGFLNYYMLRDAIEYMSNDAAQLAIGEPFKALGTVMVENYLTDNFRVISEFGQCVFSSIDGNEFKYSLGASENSFTVRCKFTTFKSTYYKGETVVGTQTYHRGNP